MNVAIDAYNIKEGGGVTHLRNLIKYFNQNYFSKVYVFCNRQVKSELEKMARDGIILIHNYCLDNCILKKIFWDIFVLPHELKKFNASVFFSPGGLLPFRRLRNIKSVTMCQNVLPFDDVELTRAGVFLAAKRLLLKTLLLRSFDASDGVIFLSSASRNNVKKLLCHTLVDTIIPHAVDVNFFQRENTDNCFDVKNIKLLYVSSIKLYKNHRETIKALSILRARGYENINIQFVGAQDKKVMKDLSRLIGKLGLNDHIKFLHQVSYEDMCRLYFNSSLFVFSSSCESFGFPLLEAMASGLPMACSNNAPFPEIVKDAAIYFNPKIPESIADAIETLIKDNGIRGELIEKAVALSKNYSCEKNADSTFSFLREIAEH
ncbi:MAG: hypothetical protein A2103_04300 [Gammaproteobacteria bacterium GWF2_41_13]|nr:MAG: hypothetical protein A2103_04300 [Gammaproteobacteria bacterium GWF2_41_13]